MRGSVGEYMTGEGSVGEDMTGEGKCAGGHDW